MAGWTLKVRATELRLRGRYGVLSFDGSAGPRSDDLRRIVLGLTERGVHVVFVKENLTFTGEDSPMSNLLLSVMGAFAQFERLQLV